MSATLECRDLSQLSLCGEAIFFSFTTNIEVKESDSAANQSGDKSAALQMNCSACAQADCHVCCDWCAELRADVVDPRGRFDAGGPHVATDVGCRAAVRLVVRRVAGAAIHPERCGGYRREALVAERLGSRRPHHGVWWRGGVSLRLAARWPAFWLVALAVRHSQDAAGDDPAGEDRLRLRSRRRSVASQPGARASRRQQSLSGLASVPRRAWT